VRGATGRPAADTHGAIPLVRGKGEWVGRFTRWAVGAALVCPTLLAAPAGASPLLVSFAGILTSVSDPQGLLPAGLAPGTSIVGTLSYASGASCLAVLPTTCEYIVSPSSLSLSLEGTPIASVDGRAYVFVEHGSLADSFSASIGGAAGPSGGSNPVWLSGDLQLSDPRGTALGGTALPTTLDLSGFAQHTFDAGGCYGGTCTGNAQDEFQIVGTILTMQVVPEPGSGTLLAFGLGSFGGWGFQRRRGSPFVAH
jgi:PEP-CTERM motif